MQKKSDKQKNTLPISRAQIEYLLKEYSTQHHVSADEMYSIMSEFVTGFEFLRQYKKAVSFYGSARLGFNHDVYEQARHLAFHLAKEGFTVITGGGPGIMEAANKGAKEAGGESVGINIKLKHEQKVNPYVDQSREFEHFFVRRTMLSFASKIYIFFPGGFGTLDELFEMLVMVQTKKIPRIPIILVGKKYWSPLLTWIDEVLYKKDNAINKEDLEIYYLVDDSHQAHELIKKMIKEEKLSL